MNLDELRGLSLENIGDWPNLAKGIAVAFVVILILGGGYFYFTKDQLAQIETLERQEQSLRTTFEEKQRKAANLEAYRNQLDEMQEILRSMLRRLPSKTEMPDLLVDISQTALSTGIDNELFEPGPEVIRDFYAEKPIALRMVGGYHQFGDFVSGVASLPRVVILTMHDISLTPQGDTGELVLEGTARTYRYVEEAELDDVDEAAS